ncbi:MAG: T9SS type A sorting domain-containing protein [Ignavibacteria bacterium]|nr:T9SS type A sorting domain-containing protein [Ignavibacteria bacterium]MBI3766816.1 T9SS type A sorting domain-containing protein [Ignavibacteriales bacterium]
MKLTLVAIVLFSLLLTPCSRSQWNWQSPVPQGNTLLGTQFLNDSLGWAVGEYGTIIHTTNGGVSWYEQEFGRTDNILALSMVSVTEGWAVGDNGTILHTIDSGDDWLEQNSGITSGLNAVTFLDSLNGWATGDNEVILHTSDGGIAWTLQHKVMMPSSINAIDFLSLTEGWAAGSSGKTFHTIDGGATWSLRVIGAQTTSYLGITFADPSLGFAVGTNGKIIRTEDGGLIWSDVSPPDSVNFNEVIMQNTFVGWIVGDGGRMLRTINGGQSWSSTIIADGYNLDGLTRASGKLWAVGEFGRIIESTNSGIAWTTLDAGSRLSVNWIDFPSSTVGVAVGQTGLLARTTDAGTTWSLSTSPSPSISCYGVKFIDDVHGWAVGDNGAILRTTDGINWSTQSSPTTSSLFGISFAGASDGWIVGGEFNTFTGSILHSSDGGGSWSIQNGSIPKILFGVSFPTTTIGWAVGDGGTILKTTDGGSSWNSQQSGISSALFWCSFVDVNTGWAVGDSGRILHTVNGGISWQTQTSNSTTALYSIVHSGASKAFIVGELGTILHTSDGGVHWESQYSRTQQSLFGAAYVSPSNIIACGDYGTVLQYIPPPVTGIISGVVFNDKNSNGILDPGEPGMPGWKVKLEGATTDSVLTLPDGSFQFTNLPLGSYTLSEALQNGWTQTMPGSLTGYSFTLTEENLSFTGNFGNYASNAYAYALDAGWNLLSFPLIVIDPRTRTVYPNALSKAFYYSSSYVERDSVQHGYGFWMDFPAAQTVWIAGSSVLADTLTVHRGWNIIGSVNDTTPISSITTNPPGIFSSNFFGYNSGYYASSIILPGKGYWLKVSQDGTLILPASGSTMRKVRNNPRSLQRASSLNSLSIADSRGRTATLHFGKSNADDLPDRSGELPPLPPAGCFDARFSNQADTYTFHADHNETATVLVQSDFYPITVTWNCSELTPSRYQLLDEQTGKEIRIEGNGTAYIPQPITIWKLKSLSSLEIPKEITLFPNYPNPFNPSTTIRYALPFAAKVSVKVYDVLGQEITTLVDAIQEAGFKTVDWDASSRASGLYFLRFNVLPLASGENQFLQTRKMVLLR